MSMQDWLNLVVMALGLVWVRLWIANEERKQRDHILTLIRQELREILDAITHHDR
jgi:hypothetical protein